MEGIDSLFWYQALNIEHVLTVDCVCRDYGQLQLLAASPKSYLAEIIVIMRRELLLLIWEGRQFLVRLSFAPVYSLTPPTMDASAYIFKLFECRKEKRAFV